MVFCFPYLYTVDTFSLSTEFFFCENLLQSGFQFPPLHSLSPASLFFKQKGLKSSNFKHFPVNNTAETDTSLRKFSASAKLPVLSRWHSEGKTYSPPLTLSLHKLTTNQH